MSEIASLNDFIVAEVNRRTSEDALRIEVEKKIDGAVKAAVDRAFQSYGNIGQQIAQTVEQALSIEGKNLDVPSYGNMLMGVLRAKMDECLNGLVNERLSAEMADILKLAPKEMTLSDIVWSMIAEVDQNDRYGSHVTCIVEASDTVAGYYHIYLDEEEDPGRSLYGSSRDKKFSCDVHMALDSAGKIYSLSVNKQDVKTAIILGGMYGWKKQLFAAYCCGTRIIVDDNDPPTGIGDL